MGQSQGSSHHQNDVTPEQLQNLVRTTGYSKSDIQDMYAKFQRDFPKGYIDEKVFRAVYASMYPMVNKYRLLIILSAGLASILHTVVIGMNEDSMRQRR